MRWRAEWPITVLAAGLALGIGVVLADRFVLPLLAEEAPSAAAIGTVQMRIVGETLEIPTNTIRFFDQRRGGEMSRVDLYGIWPSLEGFTEALRPAFDDVGPQSRIVFVSLTPRDTATDTTGRLGTIYARLFAGNPRAGPAGLVGRRLAEGSGYEDEELFFEPGAARPFVARCFTDGADAMAPMCIRELHVGRKLAALYRFRKSLLAEWRSLDASVQRAIELWLRPA